MHTFIVHVQDQPGVLNRVVSLFRRRAYNIHDIHSSRTHQAGVHRMTIWAEGDAERIAANLYKLVNVISVEEVSRQPFVARGLALLKLEATEKTRPELLQLCEVFRATAVDIGPDALIVELTGSADKIASFVDVVRPYGIREMAQTAAVAMTRCSGRAAERAA
ncbi:MAG: acetolactate synthase small subunit [Deltaproteobacteria bacterium]|nr:MAG: acetolactate synthase small subunit [Deltaproteobacteria bacterium]